MIIDQPVAADAVEKQGDVEIAEEIPTERAVRVRGRAGQHRAASTRSTRRSQELKDDGTLDELYQEYFKTDAPAVGARRRRTTSRR